MNDNSVAFGNMSMIHHDASTILQIEAKLSIICFYILDQANAITYVEKYKKTLCKTLKGILFRQGFYLFKKDFKSLLRIVLFKHGLKRDFKHIKPFYLSIKVPLFLLCLSHRKVL